MALVRAIVGYDLVGGARGTALGQTPTLLHAGEYLPPFGVFSGQLRQIFIGDEELAIGAVRIAAVADHPDASAHEGRPGKLRNDLPPRATLAGIGRIAGDRGKVRFHAEK